MQEWLDRPPDPRTEAGVSLPSWLITGSFAAAAGARQQVAASCFTTLFHHIHNYIEILLEKP